MVHPWNPLLVEDTVAAEIQACDPRQQLNSGDFQHVLEAVTDELAKCMSQESRAEINPADAALVSRRVGEMVRVCLDEAAAASKPVRTRFERFERVVCHVGTDQRGWESGIIQSVNEPDPYDPSGRAVLPYVVKLDPPSARMISVPMDEYDTVRAEVCFGQRSGALWFTLFSLPLRRSQERRFSVGERVACAVEDETDDYSVWKGGTVLDVDYSVADDAKALLPDGDWEGEAGCVPYRVKLDSGCKVLVHRDDHWLVRDLELQPEGPRQAADGTRCLKRLEKRLVNDGWQAIDHVTRKMQSCDAPDSDDSD